jgi:hypothetical protein
MKNIDLEKIKEQLTIEVFQLTQTSRAEFIKQDRSRLKTWKEKVNETNDLIQQVYQKLNDLFISTGIDFENSCEKQTLLSHIEPTVHDLVIKSIED